MISTNIALAQKVLSGLAECGVQEICVCAGARNAPLVYLLDQAIGVKIHHFFEERSASFFALGRIQRDGKPVAIVTTSGTAAAELLPAAIEATYTASPLILVTADRPRDFRGTGAPQSIDQIGIFSRYVETTQDIASVNEELNLAQWTRKAPVHINVCFSEPLIDAEVATLDFSKVAVTSNPGVSLGPSLVRTSESPVVLVGALADSQKEKVINFLEALGAPIYAEAISQLRGEKRLEKLFLNSAELSLPKIFGSGYANSIIRIGLVPTIRFWRDLEDKFIKIPVLSISEAEFKGLARPSAHIVGYSHLELVKAKWTNDQREKIFLLDHELAEKTKALLIKYPLSEPALIKQLAVLTRDQSVYLGNSLPIREWDLVADFNLSHERLFANRGANGIDGQISTFLGWAKSNTTNWSVTGDLTTLYDLSALWATRFLQQTPCRIVVINNGGGQIFKNMFGKESFLNRHQLHFEYWAKMWGWEYQLWNAIPTDVSNLGEHTVLELIPSSQQTDLFWQEYRA